MPRSRSLRELVAQQVMRERRPPTPVIAPVPMPTAADMLAALPGPRETPEGDLSTVLPPKETGPETIDATPRVGTTEAAALGEGFRSTGPGSQDSALARRRADFAAWLLRNLGR
jgi:hypothetical protein